MDESEVVERARGGDRAAMQLLYRRYADRVYSVVRRLAGEDSLAEDWAQEVWLRAFRSLGSFRGEARFATWLHRIAVNSALGSRRSALRRGGREQALPDDLASAQAEGDSLLRARLEAAIARLPDGMRKVLVLHDVEGYTHVEIAEMLGITAGTCKSQLFKARAHMRRLLGGGVSEAVHGEKICNT
jgi:RNA polymerase sigma-70 factor, ECF subfamily